MAQHRLSMPHTEWTAVVSVEHASNAVPSNIRLGIDPDVFNTHVAWDPGALPLARTVAETLKLPLHLGRWTRLVADLNRSPDNPESVPEVAFGVPVPANQGLSERERADRLETYHRPYWDQVQAEVTQALERATHVLHLSVHSFTGAYAGQLRTVEIGVMFDPEVPLERRTADVFLDTIAKDRWRTAENEPYDGRADALVTACRKVFPTDRYAGIEIELNQTCLDRLDEMTATLLNGMRRFVSR